MKIGIGVITMGKRELHPYLIGPDLPGHERGTFVVTDEHGAGVAPTRNACLRTMLAAGCEHFFLFDDDCWPVMAGWESYFLGAHRASGADFLGLPEAFKSRPLGWDGETLYWNSIVGCFSSQTRHAIDVLGGYNETYKRYGYEDAGRNHRAYKAGIAGDFEGGWASPLRSTSYIHSADVYDEHPVPNLTVVEKTRLIEANRAEWIREMGSEQICYPL